MRRIAGTPWLAVCAVSLCLSAGCDGGGNEAQGLDLGVTISVDGDVSDWARVKPLARDPAGDSPSETAGTDITDVYITADEQNLYVRIDLVNSPGTANLRYAVNFSSAETLESVELHVRGLVCDVGERRVGVMAVGGLAGGGATVEASIPRAEFRLGGDIIVECHSSPGTGPDFFDRATAGETVRF